MPLRFCVCVCVCGDFLISLRTTFTLRGSLIYPDKITFKCSTNTCSQILWQMSDDNPSVIPEMDPTLRKQIQECNWQIVNVTTPANYFHVLRRQVSGTNPFEDKFLSSRSFCHTNTLLLCQIHREFRKPLIVMAPKNLLRHKDCKSNLSEFDDVQGHPGFDKQGTRFKRLIKDQNDHSDLEEGIRRLVLCSGKVRMIFYTDHSCEMLLLLFTSPSVYVFAR